EGLIFMCLNPPTETYGFTGDSVLISTGEEKPIDDYLELTNERVVAHSTAKRCRYNGKPYAVGPLARMNLLGERLHGKAADAFKHCYSLTWVRNPLYANQARAIEILFCLEDIPRLVDKLIETKIPGIKEPTTKSGKAVGAVEAPRGALYHYYEIERGYITDANFIIPTTQNLDALERHLRIATENLLESQGTKEKDIELILEMVVRSYDPCVSCSVHLVDLTLDSK
ncbi:MAG: nickel-dependent hydrogenase large subunit, partial [bacterium]